MKEDILNRFLISVSGNPKILASHISLFSAILVFKTDEEKPFFTSRFKLMTLSKIRSTATYHKCLNNLIEMGFIRYRPSFEPKKGSEITIINSDTQNLIDH